MKTEKMLRMKNWIELNYFTLILAIFFIVLLYLICNSSFCCGLANNNLELIVALFGVFVTLVYNYNSNNISRKSLLNELFIKFNDRYDRFNEKLNKKTLIVPDKNNSTTSDEAFSIDDYLNLCAEEYYWYTNWIIPKYVWLNWSEGMHHFLVNKKYKDFLEIEKALKSNSYYDFFECDIMKKILTDKNNLKVND